MAGTEADSTVVEGRMGMLTGVVGKIKENAAQAFSDAKPWQEVFDRYAISKPADVGEMTTRVRKNATYFKTNYMIIATATTALTLFLNPWSLIVLAGLALVWFYAYILRTGPISINGREFSEKEKFLALSGTSLVTIFFLTSVGSTLFYALGLSMIMIGAHAALRQPDDSSLFLDEVPAEGNKSAGLLGLFTGSSKQVSIAAGV